MDWQKRPQIDARQRVIRKAYFSFQLSLVSDNSMMQMIFFFNYKLQYLLFVFDLVWQSDGTCC